MTTLKKTKDKQRIIKFRQWNKKRKQMFYDANFPFDGNKVSMNRQIELSQGVGTIWMQFTGLKDKNGKEIYEGDIVRRALVADLPYAVEFIAPGFWFSDGDLLHRNETNGYEVIGNIYENSELLK